jgi:hypothetical protein
VLRTARARTARARRSADLSGFHPTWIVTCGLPSQSTRCKRGFACGHLRNRVYPMYSAKSGIAGFVLALWSPEKECLPVEAEQHIRTVETHDRAGNVVGSKEVVLYAGLLSQAHEEGLAKVKTEILQIPTEENGRLAIVKAEVETTKGLFEAIGDVYPENFNGFTLHLICVGRELGVPRVWWTGASIRLIPEGDAHVHSSAYRAGPLGL